MYLDALQNIAVKAKKVEEATEALYEDNAARARYIRRWQAEHEIRNLTGRFAMYYSGGEYSRARALFSGSEQVYFQRSDVGVYEGQEAITAYFEQLAKTALPGSFRIMPITSEIIELAEDEESAQGMWFINGMEAIKNPEAPDAPACDLWVNDKLAVEYIKENGHWVILRMNINEEMRALYHKSWGDYAAMPEYPAFDQFAAPTRPADRHKPFRADRKSGKNLTTPEPYATYADLADHF